MARIRLLLLFIAAAAGSAAAADVQAVLGREAGAFLSRDYSYRDYAASPRNWVAVADRAGIVHVGNEGCVLEFDGVEWRRIPVADTTFVRGLALAADGTLYVGAVNQLGYLAVASYGEKRFVSLRDRLPSEHRDFGAISAVAASADGVFFAAGNRLFRWRDGAFRIWQLPGETAITLHAARGRILVHRRGEPLSRVEGDALVPWSEAPFFREHRLIALLAVGFESDDLIACSAEGELARVVADGTVRPFPTEADDWLRREGAQAAASQSGSFVLASRQAGLVVLGSSGEFLRRIDQADGLRDLQVHAIFSGENLQLWLCHDNGLTRLQLPASASVFGRNQGLDGTAVQAVVRHAGTMRAATGRGVYELRPADPRQLANARFVRMAGLDARYAALLGTPAGLLAGGSDGVEFLADQANQTERVYAGAAVTTLAASTRVAGRVWAGSSEGVFALDRIAGAWRVACLPRELGFEVRSCAESDDGWLWLGTPARGVARVRGFAGPGEPAAPLEVEFLDESRGLPRDHGAVQVARAGPFIVAACADGSLLRFEPGRGAFVAATAKTAGGILGFAPAPRSPVAWLPARDLHGAGAIAEFDAAGNCEIVSAPAIFEATGLVRQIYGDTTPSNSPSVVWLAGTEGLGRHAAGSMLGLTVLPGIRLRGAALDGKTAWPRDNLVPAGPHRFTFAFSASAFAEEQQFASRLEGLEADFTSFSTQRMRDFSGLAPGHYVLHVQATNRGTRSPPVALFAFDIAPPWWATPWARAAAALCVVAAGIGAAQWRSRTLRRRNERLEQLVAARTAELRASEEQLRGARDAAEAANRAKSAFLAHMSHELRTPLNGILGYAQVMARADSVDPANRERLRVIRESGEHLLKLINEVLDLSKIEAGRIEVRSARCDLPRLLASVADIFRPRAMELGLAFETHFATDLPPAVLVDEAKLTQVLVNLLGNAFKFTRRGGVTFRVAVAADASATGPSLTFSIEDTGVGIAPADLERIFRPFVQVGEMADGQGTGLGLAISQRIVAVLGGELRVNSEPGRGSRFWFELALPVAEAGTAPGNGTGRITGYAGARRRVLVVDDHAVNRDVLSEFLAPLGFTVRAAADGPAAIEAAAEVRPDLVLLDLRMEPMDGLTVARELRARPGGAELKIVAISASAFEFDRAEALRHGCDGFVAKPFVEADLLAEIARPLGLEWTRAAPDPSGHGALERPAAEIVAELRTLAADGKVPRLRRRLAALREADPRHAAFYARVDALAGRFELKQIESLLAE